MVQASCYQLVLDRKLGEYTSADGGDCRGGETGILIAPRAYSQGDPRVRTQ
jgi:hypothetical protein